MTYYSGKDMARSFRTVRGNTLKIAEEIPENKYDFKPTPEVRSIGQLLVHIAFGPGFQEYVLEKNVDDLGKVNFPELIPTFMAKESKPRTKAEIIALLKSEGDKFASLLESIPEGRLAEQVKMPPGAEVPTKSRFEMLLGPKEHEMHHRAQLMTIQRMLGLTPHLTRQMQERMAHAQQAAGQQAR